MTSIKTTNPFIRNLWKKLYHAQYIKLFITFFSLAIPVGLQGLLTYAVNLTDSIMVGKLGETALSAVTVATQPFFLFMTFLLSLSSAGCVLISQYWGQHDTENINQVLGLVYKTGILIGIPVFIVVLLVPEQILRLYTDDSEVVLYGVQYLTILAFSFLPFIFTSIYLASIRGVEKVRIALLTNSIAFIVNFFFNYMLIFGNFGAPQLGIRGAAYATVLARLAELIIVAFYALHLETRIQLGLHYLFDTPRQMSADFLKIALPVIFNEMIWAVGASIHNAILGHISVSAVTTVSIANTAFQIMTVFIAGAAAAILVIIGKSLGSSQIAKARKDAKILVMMTIGLAAVTACILLAGRDFFISFYELSPSTQEAVRSTLIATAAVILIYSINMASIVGVFRAGGDTRFAMYLDIFSVWCVAIPLGLLAAFVWELPLWAVYFCLRSDEIIKAFCCFIHLKKGNWIKVLVKPKNMTIETTSA